MNRQEEQALELLREARAAMIWLNEIEPSRKMSVAITQAETAILWLQHALQGVNEEQAP